MKIQINYYISIYIYIYIGLLISHGSNKAHNVKLSHSGKLNILALNSFGMYAYVNISIQVNYIKNSIRLYYIEI